ncbi:uncharacterized protein LOC144652265 isoform X7 [Oculina patagonica]
MESKKKTFKGTKQVPKKKSKHRQSTKPAASPNLVKSTGGHPSQFDQLTGSSSLLQSTGGPSSQFEQHTGSPSLFQSTGEHPSQFDQLTGSPSLLQSSGGPSSQFQQLTGSPSLLQSTDGPSSQFEQLSGSPSLLQTTGTPDTMATNEHQSPSQQFPTDKIVGYVHQVSNIYTPKSGNVYFDFNVQMSPTKVVRGICYSPEKRLKLKELQEKKVAVTIDSVQPSLAKRRATEDEYTIKKKSKITPSVVNYDFNEAFSKTSFTLDQIAEISDYQTISVNAKIISKTDESAINVRGKNLNKVDYVIADPFASIKLVVWEEIIDIDINKTYSFTSVSVRSFNDVKYLTTTKYTTVKQIDNFTQTADATPTIQNYGKIIQGKVVAVNIVHFKTCIFCNMKIQISDNDSTATKCSNCKMTVLTSQLRESTLSKIVIKEQADDFPVTYTALESVLNTFLTSVKKPNIKTFTELELLTLLASYQKLNFTVSQKEKLVSNISVNLRGN